MIAHLLLALQAVAGTPATPRPTAAAARASASEPRRSKPTLRVHHGRRVVVVDAGHGGPDNGMSGPIGTKWKVYEKNITLAVAKKLATALEERGLDVVMTRTTDTLIALSDRGRIANEHHGDLFISVHVNAANPRWKDPGAARGFETYFLAEAKTEDAKRVEQMENESVRFETGAQAAKDDPLNFIINDMAQNEHLRESSALAEAIQARLGRVEPGPSRGVKQAGFVVLVTAFMPAVLVEIGFGTNPAEARFINNSANQKEIAGAIADATLEYLDQYERRLNGGTKVGDGSSSGGGSAP
jgi:N-acetylmuramoyl-L-alanine amidase